MGYEKNRRGKRDSKMVNWDISSNHILNDHQIKDLQTTKWWINVLHWLFNQASLILLILIKTTEIKVPKKWNKTVGSGSPLQQTTKDLSVQWTCVSVFRKPKLVSGSWNWIWTRSFKGTKGCIPNEQVEHKWPPEWRIKA